MFSALLLIVCLQISPPVPTIPYLPSPTPVPTYARVTAEPAGWFTDQVINYLSTGVAVVNALPADISKPGGVAILPDENAQQIFSYGKWLFSGSSTQEIFGRTISVIPNRLFIYFVLIVTLEVIWFFFNPLSFALRGVPFLYQIFIRFALGRK